jgi:hypothetical protein
MALELDTIPSPSLVQNHAYLPQQLQHGIVSICNELPPKQPRILSLPMCEQLQRAHSAMITATRSAMVA